MLSVFRTLSLRFLRRRWFRALLIVASIALGVGTLVATRALNETMTKASQAIANPMAGIADFIVTRGDDAIDGALADAVGRVPGVKATHKRIFSTILLREPPLHILLMGVDLREIQDQKNPQMEITVSPGIEARYAAALLFRQTPAIVGKELQQQLAEHGPVLRVKKNALAPEHEIVDVGWIEAKGDAAALGGQIIIVDLASSAKILGLQPGHVSRIDVVLQPGADRAGVRARIEKVLDGRADVRTPEEQNQTLQSVMSGMQTGFALGGIAALVVGLFLVYNALAVSVAERRHEIGIILSLGGTREQVRRLFAFEAAVLGLAGSLLGIPLGVGLAYLGLGPIQEVLQDVFFTLNASSVEISGGLVLAALAAGILTAVVATLGPAIQASRENPAEAVRKMIKPPTLGNLFLQIIASAAMILIGILAIVLRRQLPPRVGSYGGLIAVLLGALLATPFLAALAARLIQPVVKKFLGIEWRLGADNLVRSPGRTGLVIAALAAGVALVMQTAGTIHSSRLALHEWVQESIASDLIITSGGPVGAGGKSLPMEESLRQEIQNIPEVEAALPVRFRKEAFRDTRIFLLATDAARSYELEQPRLPDSRDLHLFKAMAERKNAVIVSENFTAIHGLHEGDSIRLPTNRGWVTFHIIGKVVDYTWPHGTVYINRPDFLEYWQDTSADVYDVYLRPGADPLDVKKTILTKFGAQHGLHALTREELVQRIDDLIERLYGIGYGQQVVVMIVAALGVVTALLISVLQRRREMGLLRAIGASRMQVIYTVLAEACLMGLIGTIIGVIVGVPLQWYVLQVVMLDESGNLFPVYVPWLGALVIAAGAMIVATLAGLGPAIYAVRQRIPEAIAYE